MATNQPTQFSSVLRTLREKSGISRYRLSQCSGPDEGNLGRLESGQRSNPSRDTVIKIGLALVQNTEEVSIYDVQELLLAAGFAPLLGRNERIIVN